MPTQLLTVAEVAKRLRCSTKTVQRYVACNRLASVRLSPKAIRIEESALEAFLESCKVATS